MQTPLFDRAVRLGRSRGDTARRHAQASPPVNKSHFSYIHVRQSLDVGVGGLLPLQSSHKMR